MEGLKRNGTRKLDDTQVRQLKQLYEEGYTQGSLARYFGISIGQIGRIVRGESRRETGTAALPQQRLDEIAARMLALSQHVQEHGPMEGIPFTPKAERKPPPMLLDGGDAPDETGGMGLSTAQKRALEFGVDMDRVLEMKE